MVTGHVPVVAEPDMDPLPADRVAQRGFGERAVDADRGRPSSRRPVCPATGRNLPSVTVTWTTTTSDREEKTLGASWENAKGAAPYNRIDITAVRDADISCMTLPPILHMCRVQRLIHPQA